VTSEGIARKISFARNTGETKTIVWVCAQRDIRRSIEKNGRIGDPGKRSIGRACRNKLGEIRWKQIRS
jgi:hypothetical protein